MTSLVTSGDREAGDLQEARLRCAGGRGDAESAAGAPSGGTQPSHTVQGQFKALLFSTGAFSTVCF